MTDKNLLCWILQFYYKIVIVIVSNRLLTSYKVRGLNWISTLKYHPSNKIPDHSLSQSIQQVQHLLLELLSYRFGKQLLQKFEVLRLLGGFNSENTRTVVFLSTIETIFVYNAPWSRLVLVNMRFISPLLSLELLYSLLAHRVDNKLMF